MGVEGNLRLAGSTSWQGVAFQFPHQENKTIKMMTSRAVQQNSTLPKLVDARAHINYSAIIIISTGCGARHLKGFGVYFVQHLLII